MNALDRATSDFERDALGDLTIARDEYEEAVDRYVRCAVGHGVNLVAVPQGGYYVYDYSSQTFAASSESRAVVESCRAGTVEFIEPLFVEILINPQRRDHDELLVSCFVDKGLVSHEYSAADYRRDVGQADLPASLPFEESDQRFHECMVNPSR